ncbi:hypothetical protein VPH35_107710 [Triticum aestivum]
MAVPCYDSGSLPIRVLSHRLVKASDPSIEPHVAAVSNLDLYPNIVQASIVCLYPKPKLPKLAAGDFRAVAAVFEGFLPSLLNHFYPLAGRIVTNPTSGLPELHCHNQGAELIVGEVGVALGSLDYSQTEESLKKMMLPYPEEVTLSVQLLSFSCGGFSVVWGNNNLVNDGHAITMMVRMWSELVRTGTIVTEDVPNHNRSVFRARDPLSYGVKVGDMFAAYDHDGLVNALTAHDSFVERLYYIEASTIARLRELATSTGGQQLSSRVQALSAYLWKVLATVVATSRVREERCRMLWWVDGRRRITSPELVPAMRSYFGNVTTYVVEEAAVEEIQRKPLAEVAAMVREAITSIDYDEHIQELVDWVEEHKKQKIVEKTVFASFPLDMDFGFGQATLAMPVWHHGRLASGNLAVGTRPGGDGSWIVNAYVWPRLAAALESDGQCIFKPVTAEYLQFEATIFTIQHTIN